LICCKEESDSSDSTLMEFVNKLTRRHPPVVMEWSGDVEWSEAMEWSEALESTLEQCSSVHQRIFCLEIPDYEASSEESSGVSTPSFCEFLVVLNSTGFISPTVCNIHL